MSDRRRDKSPVSPEVKRERRDEEARNRTRYNSRDTLSPSSASSSIKSPETDTRDRLKALSNEEPEERVRPVKGLWLRKEMEMYKRDNNIESDDEPTEEEIVKHIKLPTKDQIDQQTFAEPIKRWVEVKPMKSRAWSWSRAGLPEEEEVKGPDWRPPTPPRVDISLLSYLSAFTQENVSPPHQNKIFRDKEEALRTCEEDEDFVCFDGAGIIRGTKKGYLEAVEKQKEKDEKEMAEGGFRGYGGRGGGYGGRGGGRGGRGGGRGGRGRDDRDHRRSGGGGNSNYEKLGRDRRDRDRDRDRESIRSMSSSPGDREKRRSRDDNRSFGGSSSRGEDHHYRSRGYERERRERSRSRDRRSTEERRYEDERRPGSSRYGQEERRYSQGYDERRASYSNESRRPHGSSEGRSHDDSRGSSSYDRRPSQDGARPSYERRPSYGDSRPSEPHPSYHGDRRPPTQDRHEQRYQRPAPPAPVLGVPSGTPTSYKEWKEAKKKAEMMQQQRK